MKNVKLLDAIRIPFLVFTLFILFSSNTNTQEEDTLFLSSIDAIVEDEIIKQEIIGIAVGVVKNGQIIHTKGYGHHDLDRTRRITSNTVFRWASISKTLNAVAAFQLIEAGKIALHDKVHNYVSNWPSSGSKGKVTLSHVLSNTGGIRHYEQYNRLAYPSVYNNLYNSTASVEVFKGGSLLFTPGTDYEYTTFGHNLAGAALDGAAPNGYIRWVDRKIAGKAEMNSLTAYSTSPKGYDKNCYGKLKTENEGSTTWKLPGGGWASNIKDLTKFMQGMMNGTFLNNTAALWQSVPNVEEGYRYGIHKSGSGNALNVYHSGAHDDVRTMLRYYPNTKVGVCVMINGGSYVSVSRVTDRIFTAIGTTRNRSDDPRNKCPEKSNGDLKSTCGKDYAGVWRDTDTESIIRRGYGHDEFYDTWEQLRQQGYHCVDFDTYLDGTVRKWDGVFKKGASGSAMWRGFNNDDFYEKWKEMSKKGYKLIDLETYLSGTKRKWAGLFEKASYKQAMWRGYNKDDFGDKRNEMKAKGYKLVDVETYKDGTKRKWAGVWHQGSGELLNRYYKTDDFKQLRRDRRDAGYKLIDVETFMDNGTRKWAGIWEKSNKAEAYYYGYQYCDLIYKYNSKISSGYEMIDLERY